jgi:hypothetical protein
MKSHSFKTFLAATLIALVPSFANANSIGISGTLAGGATATSPFSVTDAGTFNFSSTGGLFVSVSTSAGGSGGGLGFLNDFDLFLGLGSYILSVTNNWPFSATSYTTTISSRDGIVGAGATSVPEPGSLILIGSGLLGLALLRRRRAQQAA